jgi:hypothetical protein
MQYIGVRNVGGGPRESSRLQMAGATHARAFVEHQPPKGGSPFAVSVQGDRLETFLKTKKYIFDCWMHFLSTC